MDLKPFDADLDIRNLYDEYMSKVAGCNGFNFQGGADWLRVLRRNHMEAWQREPRAKIVAVCDLDPARARAMASSFSVDRVYTDAAEMLKSENA